MNEPGVLTTSPNMKALDTGADLPTNLPVEFVAKYLCISKSKVYEMIRLKQLPCFKIGHRNIIPRDLFFEWIQQKAKVVDEQDQ